MTSGIVPAYLTTLLDLLTGYGLGTAIRASVTKFSSFSPACSSPLQPLFASPPYGPWTQRGVLPLTRWRFHSQFTLAGIFVYPIYIARTSVKGEEKQVEARAGEYSDERNLVPRGIAINVK